MSLPDHGDTSMNYLAYIASQAWAEKRTQALKRDNFRCRLCNSRNDLEVHHRSYGGALGTETIDDLTTLCQDCHASVSAMIRRRRSRGESPSTSTPIRDLRIEEIAEEYEAGERNRAPNHPGVVIATALKAMQIRPATAAPLLGTTRVTLGRIINQQAPVTTEMALRLGKFFGNGPMFWRNLQIDHNLYHAEQKMAEQLAAIEPIEPA